MIPDIAPARPSPAHVFADKMLPAADIPVAFIEEALQVVADVLRL